MQHSDFLDFLALFDQAKSADRIKANMVVFKSAHQSRFSKKQEIIPIFKTLIVNIYGIDCIIRIHVKAPRMERVFEPPREAGGE
jgi:hypothetical protein